MAARRGYLRYSSNMLRRAFLQTLPAAAVAITAEAAEESPVKLGFDTYSLRAFKWKGTQLLDYAAGLKLDTIQFSALADYGSLDPQNLQKVKSRAQELGISIDSGMGCICESAKAFNKNGPPARAATAGRVEGDQGGRVEIHAVLHGCER